MNKAKGFIRTPRKDTAYRPVCERIKDYREVALIRREEDASNQASRCMDCGTPFCHDACPIGNYIPEWNEMVFSGRWEQAAKLLYATNPLPEITGRICPALCEYSCVLALNDDAVTIKDNELNVAEYGLQKNLVGNIKINKKTNKKIAIIGSGPAGLSCADRLNMVGHDVTVFEKDKKIGGLLRYGIPDFKLEKRIIDRRVDIWKKQGIVFNTRVHIESPSDISSLMNEFDAISLACGCRIPRDINIPGRDLEGIYLAMDYLCQANQIVSGEAEPKTAIGAKNKKVVVIGGGDTGSDCVGTANRQEASCVVQLEIMPMPSRCRTRAYPWPRYPLILKNSSSHEEGVERKWSVITKQFIGTGKTVSRLLCAKAELYQENADTCPVVREIPDTDFEIEADMVLIAAGFMYPEKAGFIDTLGIDLDKRGTVKTQHDYMTSQDKIFCAGDMRRGQSLVAWAIAEGMQCAYHIDKYLMGESSLNIMQRM
jgi:glutamate synthase (NADPH) small chain